LKIAWEGEAPAEPQTMESVIFHAAQQELRPPEECRETTEETENTKVKGETEMH